MSKFWASSSSSSSDDDSDSGSSNSSSSLSSSSSSSDSLSASSSPAASLERAATPSTPTRQPILPVDDPNEAWRRIRPHQVFAAPPTRTGPVDPSVCTRIVCISDTHGYHRSIPLPSCDVLIHGGDFTNYGEPDMVKDVSEYFSELLKNGIVRERVICIAGNHELTFERDHYDQVWKRFQRPKQDGKFDDEAARKALTNCTYLEDEAVAVGPIQFYGSPWQPKFYDWAFNVPRAEIESKWERIPTNTDVLITHGPPLGRGDVAYIGIGRVGCVSLMKHVQSRVKPRLHVFGHVHEGYGITHDGTTMYVNASSVSKNYTQHNPSIVVDLPHDHDMPAQLVNPDCRLDADELLVWLRRNGYERTVNQIEEHDGHLTGSDIVDRDFDELCCSMMIHRDEEAKVELKQVMTQLWLESFD